MKQIKIIYASCIQELTERTNAWLEKNYDLNIVDIQPLKYLQVMIVYEASTWDVKRAERRVDD